jgi:hypothetical protein
MVKQETITLDTEAVRDLVQSAIAVRAPSGSWTVTVSLSGELKLDDDRTLPVRKQVKFKSNQIGRKPNPSWGKHGFKKKE